MKTTYISSIALADSTRSQIMKQTSNLNKLQIEMSTLRKADIGLALGSQTGEAVSVRAEYNFLNSIKDTNKLTSSRLDVSQAAMGNINTNAQDVMASLIAVRDTNGAANAALAEASSAMASMTSMLNTQQNGSYLFSGLNVGVQPMEDYFAAGAANKNAVDTAFRTHFGTSNPPTDAELAAITPAAMENYLDTVLPIQFDNANWAANWSDASDTNTSVQIAINETITSSVSANEQAFRDLAEGYAMILSTGDARLSDETYRTVLDKAIEKIGGAINGVTDLMGVLGTSQQRLKRASEGLDIQTTLLNERINSLENVNKEETAVLLNSALTQLETSYAVSARMQRLSLLNYL